MPEVKDRRFILCKMRLLIIPVLLILIAPDADAQERTPSRRGSQIVNDSTKQIYGPRTSRVIDEKDVFLNRYRYRPIDTVIRNFHRFDYVQRYGNMHQDLGVIGSAIQPIFYNAPRDIGRRSGAHVYDLYWETEPVRYFDTKSPYTNMRVILGGRGRSVTRANYSRSANARVNFGFNYRGLLIDKQILRTGGRGDRVVRNHYYDAFATYKSKDSTYRLFTNIRRSFHRMEEFGGIRLDADDSLSESFSENAQPWLTNAESNDLRINFHLAHEYRIGKALQVYHAMDRFRQNNGFTDRITQQTEPFYDLEVIGRDTVNDVIKFKALRNEIGIKGNVSRLFYNGYYAIRDFSYRNNNLHPGGYDTLDFQPRIGRENYIGGRIALMLDSIGEVNAGLEVMDEGAYKFEAGITSRWFEAHLRQMQHFAGFIEQSYRGAFDIWNNNFQLIQSTQLNGYLHYRSEIFRFSPGLTFTRLGNYVFYKKVRDSDTQQQVLPVQSSGSQVIASPEVRLSATFIRRITLSGNAIYTELLENADDAISVPKLFINAQLAYSNIFFNGNFELHTGVDVHWRSDYYAMGYDVAIRQFYIQNDFRSPSFPLVDLFLNAKVKRGRIFFRYHNFVQAFTQEGYFPTPGYVGQRNTFDFGFDWSFYD